MCVSMCVGEGGDVCTGIHAYIYDHCLAMAHPVINLHFSTSYNFAKLRPLRLNTIQPNLHSRDLFCADREESGCGKNQHFAFMEKILTAGTGL